MRDRMGKKIRVGDRVLVPERRCEFGEYVIDEIWEGEFVKATVPGTTFSYLLEPDEFVKIGDGDGSGEE